MRPTTNRWVPAFRPMTAFLTAMSLVATLAGCGQPADRGPSTTADGTGDPAEATMNDPHSYARPDQVAIKHIGLDLTVDFDNRRLTGRATLQLKRKVDFEQGGDAVVLDTRDLDIQRVFLDDDSEPSAFELSPPEPYLGSRLNIPLAPDTKVVHIDYATRPEAAAVQWLAPGQTAGGEHPFLFTQSQAILARTWVPCQDSPAVRFTYDATIRTPSALMAVMSAAGNPTAIDDEGVYRFEMPQPIPSYLLALAVGDLAFAPLGDRTGVYAEPAMLDQAAAEFVDTESMMMAVEDLYGPYRWERYDILVLPPSFPFGGMENPRLTFATPTIIAGDRSLVALIAHELAHSWSGNLVTNANWDDFWLNEGFTVYLERRIMEALRGRDYADMLSVLGRQDLDGTIADLGADHRDTHLHLDLAGRDPDDGMNDVAYEKGYFFLRGIEQAVGRARFDTFLRAWFDEHAFTSETSESFIAYLDRNLLAGDEDLRAEVDTEAWIHGPGLPSSVPEVESAAFASVDEAIAGVADGTVPTDTEDWTTHEWLHFLRGLPHGIDTDQMATLDAAFGFTGSGNAEILHAWLHHVIASQYQPAYPRLEAFLLEVGRRKFLKPLYERLAETEDGKAWARDVYSRARPGYHTVSSSTIDDILDWNA